MQTHWIKISMLQLTAVRIMSSDTSDSIFNMILKIDLKFSYTPSDLKTIQNIKKSIKNK